MEPAHVWLVFVPIVNLFWPFICVLKVKESLEREIHDRGIPNHGDGGFSSGIILVVSMIFCLPLGIIMFFVYHRKMSSYLIDLQISEADNYKTRYGGQNNYEQNRDNPEQ
jgi:hypothetical protein